MISTTAPTPLASPAGVKDAEGSLAKLEGQHDLVSAIKLYIQVFKRFSACRTVCRSCD